MKKQYRVYTADQDKVEYSKGDLIFNPKINNSIRDIAKEDSIPNAYNQWQAQYMYICSDEIPIYGKWVLSIRGWIGKFGKHENSYPEECKPVIATNNHKCNLSSITESDLRYWVESGCKDVVDLEMDREPSAPNTKVFNMPSQYKWFPLIENSCVVFARDENKMKCICYSDEEKQGCTATCDKNYVNPLVRTIKAMQEENPAINQDSPQSYNLLNNISPAIASIQESNMEAKADAWIKQSGLSLYKVAQKGAYIAGYKECDNELNSSKEPVMSAEDCFNANYDNYTYDKSSKVVNMLRDYRNYIIDTLKAPVK